MSLELAGEIHIELKSLVAEQPRNSNSTRRNHMPAHTIRRTDMIALLTNLRTEVDRAIHNMPGVLLGVSFANVIQSAMHLNWSIEYLKGSLIETMVHERHNPFPDGEERPVRPQISHSVDRILHSPEIPLAPIARSQAPMNGYSTPNSRMEPTSTLGPRTIRQTRHDSVSTSNHTPSTTTVVRNQVISVPSSRRPTDNTIYYYGDIAARISNASSPPRVSTNGPMSPTNNQELIIDVEHYPEVPTSTQNRPNYRPNSVVEYDL
jgi:hypothetical protein